MRSDSRNRALRGRFRWSVGLRLLLALAGFALTWPIGAAVRRRQRLAEPFVPEPPLGHEVTDTHPHVHGPDCGHVAVTHGDHVDYVHDGHRHWFHHGHWDEH